MVTRYRTARSRQSPHFRHEPRQRGTRNPVTPSSRPATRPPARGTGTSSSSRSCGCSSNHGCPEDWRPRRQRAHAARVGQPDAHAAQRHTFRDGVLGTELADGRTVQLTAGDELPGGRRHHGSSVDHGHRGPAVHRGLNQPHPSHAGTRAAVLPPTTPESPLTVVDVLTPLDAERDERAMRHRDELGAPPPVAGPTPPAPPTSQPGVIARW